MRKNTCRAFSGPVTQRSSSLITGSHRHSPHQLGWKFWHNQFMTKLWVKKFEAVSESLFLPPNFFLFHFFAIEIFINSTCHFFFFFFRGGKKVSILTRNNLNVIFVCLLGEDEAEVPRSTCNNLLTAVS